MQHGFIFFHSSNALPFFHPCRLVAEYENIAEKALTTPANTEQLMELKQFVETTEKVSAVDFIVCIIGVTAFGLNLNVQSHLTNNDYSKISSRSFGSRGN